MNRARVFTAGLRSADVHATQRLLPSLPLSLSPSLPIYFCLSCQSSTNLGHAREYKQNGRALSTVNLLYKSALFAKKKNICSSPNSSAKLESILYRAFSFTQFSLGISVSFIFQLSLFFFLLLCPSLAYRVSSPVLLRLTFDSNCAQCYKTFYGRKL